MTIRPALPDDADAIANVHIASWRAAYRGQLPDAYLAALDTERSARGWSQTLADSKSDVVVAEQDRNIVGFASLSPSRDADADSKVGEITSIYLLSEYWRRHIGTELFEALLQCASKRGYSEITLWVLASNQQARDFYESRGFFVDGAEKHEPRPPDLTFHEIRYRTRAA